MAGNWNWITTVDNALSQPLADFISTGASGVSAYATGPLTAAVTLYVMIYGYAILVGRVSDPLNEFIWRCLKLGVILMLVKNAGDYNTYVADVFFNTLPREIAGALNAGQATTAATFDGLLAKGQEVVTQLWTQAGFGISASICSALAAVIVIVCVSFVSVRPGPPCCRGREA